MAQPTKYVPDYDFSDWQAAHPADPLPGNEVDSELGLIKVTTDQIIDNLALIQRDDGALANQSVHPDALSTEVASMIGEWNPRGAWVTATVYAKLDMVREADVNYICIVAHTSGVFATDLAAGKWQVISAAGINSISNSQLAQMPTLTLKGNNTGGTANADDLTMAEVAAILPAVVGDSGSGGTKGLAPAPSAGDAAANKFLKASGTFAAIQDATESVKGIGELANQSEATTGSSDALLMTPLKTRVANIDAITFVVTSDTGTVTSGTNKKRYRMPYAFTVTAVRASLVTAQTSGSILTVDINESGSTILSTKLTVDNGEKTSTTAATPAVVSDTALADDAEISIDVDQVGDGTAQGLKVTLIGYRA